MATGPQIGKTILQLDAFAGTIVLANTFLEIHVEGTPKSVKIPLADLPIKGDNGEDGKSALEIIQETHPEIVTDEDLIEFLTGPRGQSPYDLAVENGFEGTASEWLESLVGAAGKSAYEIAVERGFSGSMDEWILSLKGEKGEDGNDGEDGESTYEIAVRLGQFTGTEAEFIAAQKGADGENGKDAYEVAVDDGYVGSRSEWIASLRGQRGPDGRTAYQVAQANGFPGTEAEWLLSLKGTNGEDGKNATLGVWVGSVSTEEDLPDPSGYVDQEYFFVGKNVYMCRNGSWENLGDFSGPAGRDGTGFQILGELASIDFLPLEGDRVGDAYLIAKSMWVWNGTRWQEQGQQGLQGEKGEDGDKGDDGDDALEVLRRAYPELLTPQDMAAFLKGETGETGPVAISWVTDGVLETEAELPAPGEGVEGHGWLVGAAAPYDFHLYVNGDYVNLGNQSGPQGTQGQQGIQGERGFRGNSYKPMGELDSIDDLPTTGNEEGHTYRIDFHDHTWDGIRFVDMGNLRGADGKTGEIGPVGQPVNPKGIVGSVGELPTTGNEVSDAYEVNGFIYVWNGIDWINMNRWRGTDGVAGKSAYQIAVDNGYVGTQPEWLETLKGTRGEDGTDGDDGKDVVYVGDFANQAGLPAPTAANEYATAGGFVYRTDGVEWFNTGAVGVAGANGKSAYQVAVDGGYVGSEAEWLLTLRGPDGRSAYQVAVANGYSGTEVEWIASLTGANGRDGRDTEFVGDFANQAALPVVHTANQLATAEGRVYRSNGTIWTDIGAVGRDGTNGSNGKSAYQLAVDDGFNGTLTEWLVTLRGESAYQVAVRNGFVGTEPQWIASLKGEDGEAGKSIEFVGDFPSVELLPENMESYQIATAAGRVYYSNGTDWVDVGAVGIPGEEGPEGKNAFEVAQAAGFEGTREQWLESLKGVDGKSAYDLAVDNGYVGTEQEWIASLKGATGASAYQQAVAEGFVGDFDAWIETLRGATGQSVYDEAVAGGFEGTFEEFVETLRGEQGIQGNDGPRGATGPIVPIKEVLANEAALPTPGNSAEAYAIESTTEPGKYDAWVWLDGTQEWFNLGTIAGAKGEEGQRGRDGIQGRQGERGFKGDPGTQWIVFDRDPQPLDGVLGDLFYNNLTQEYFRKTGQTVWASLGHIGGGNLNRPTSNGKPYAMLDGVWVNLAVLDVPTATGVYGLRGGQWVSLGAPVTKVIEATTSLDFSAAGQFNMTNNSARTVTITGLPAAGESCTRVVKVRGQTGSWTWTPPAGVTLRWFDGAGPTFENPTTTIVFNYDGIEIVGSVPN